MAFTENPAEAGFILIPVTKVKLLTVMAQVAVLLPSCVVVVMVALPAATPVTRPRLLTVATDDALELQLTVLLAAFEGETVADICCAPFTKMFTNVGLMLTSLTCTVVPTFPPYTEYIPPPSFIPIGLEGNEPNL